MQLTDKNIIPLYRYEEENKSVTITPKQRNDTDPIYQYRLVADESCELYYNGENQHTSVLDVFDINAWTQEVIPEEPSEGESEGG